ncbi:MAG: metallophosphoesterase [Clostridia bacterium]|nr:metallophosphoesterase [Clostridia bacterium]
MTYAISDIHGEYALFMRLMEHIGYSDSDRLIVCGDFIDKGRDTVRLAKTLFAMPEAYCLTGNHEHAFFQFYRTRMHSAVMDFDAILWQLQQYFPAGGEDLDWETVDRLVDLPYYMEEERFIGVHAGLPLTPDGRLKPLGEVTREEMIHDRRFKDACVLPRESRCVLFGHTPTSYVCGEPRILIYPRHGVVRPTTVADCAKIHLDTGATASGVLGCVRLDDLHTFYVRK